MGAISDWVVRKVLFEPVTFEWITETHKKDKWGGGAYSMLENGRAEDSDRNAVDVFREQKESL